MNKNYTLRTGFKAALPTLPLSDLKSTTLSLFIALFTLFGVFDGYGQVTTDTYTATGAGTWTAPCGVTSVTVEAWGAGGSGGGNTANISRGGGGGAGGTYSSSTFVVVPGTTYNLFVAPGTTGTAAAGAKGQGSWFNTNAILFAEGGNGGAACNAVLALGGLGSIGTSIGTTRTAGANGNNGGGAAPNEGGAGGAGSTGGGAGGALRGSGGGNGRIGNAIGGGGGGAYVNDNNDRNGGSGARGEVRITYTNVIPANPGNPTSNSPQCNPPGVTLTRVGAPPVGVVWYWQTTALGTSTANSGNTFLATTSGTYYLRAQHTGTGCWSTGSGSRAIVISTAPATVATPTPANAATGVCYAGGGAVSSISWGAAAGATSYDVYFGAGSLPGSLTSNVATNTYNTGALAANTTYYWRIVAKNACGDAVTSATFTFTTAATPCALVYCASSGGTFADGITGVNFNTINNLGTSVNTGYTDFTSISTTVIKTSSYNLNVYINTGGNYTNYQSVYIDWNGDGDFVDAGEFYNLGTANNVTNGLSSLSPLSITIPAGAISGTVRMRIQSRYNAATTGPCQTGFDGEVEDYTLNIIPATPCVAPTTQPSTLSLTPSGSSISGSFAPAVPYSDNYLVVINTTGIAPTAPVNGTTYIIGNTLGAGNTIIDTDNTTSFVANGLSTTTTYYFFIYAYNSLCIGGPIYNTVSPLTGNSTTTTADPTYCTPSVGATYENFTYFTNIAFVGTLNDVANASTFSSAPRGFQDFTTLPNRSQQAQGQGVNISTQTNNRGYLKAWVDWNKDGDFDDLGEKVYEVSIASYSTTFGFIIPPAQPVGNYRIRIRINKDDNTLPYDVNAISTFDSCQNIDYYGETEDYVFTVIPSCSAYITGITEGVSCGTGTVNLAATSIGGATQYRWYTTEFGGTPIATTATGAWTTPVISTTTTYWVTAFNGCESLVRTKVRANINPIATISFTPSVPEVCGENQVLSLTAAGDVQQTYLVDEPFNAGLGVMSNVDLIVNGATDAISQWQNQTSTFVPAEQVWFPAIASGINGNNFAMSTSDTGSAVTENAILSPTVSTNTYLNLTLSFDIFYSRYYVDGTSLPLDYVTIDVSTDSGGTWTEIDRYTADIGYGTRFVNKTYNLNSYINNPNFRVRIRYYGEWCDGLAIDNFKLYGDVPLNTSFDWSTLTPVAAFTDFACSSPYITGTPITTVYIRPTLAQLEDATYSFTATASLSNGCSVSQNVSIDNKSKVWKGGTNGDWTVANNWLPVGVPDATNCVIIPTAPNNSLIGGTNVNGFGKTLQVIGNGNLTIDPTNTLTITDFVEVRDVTSVFNIENSGSLIQINNVANTGTINMRRNAITNSPLDYVYWSTPVAGFSVNAITPASTYRYQWNPTTVTGFASNFGNWLPASGGMTTGRGYIIRGSSGASTFTGVPNNGNINTNITRSTYIGGNYVGPTSTMVTQDDDNWNLLGNPYPSAISADAFLAANSSNLNQFVKIWAHGIDPTAAIADPFYQDYVLNYSTGDYLTYNALGGTQAGFDGLIGAGQGFFVLMNNAASTSENAVFNNTMRNNAYRNDQFYRNGDGIERNRIWLDIISPSNASITTLVGYTAEASDNLDTKFDAIAQGVKTNFELYSIAESQELIIQGRSLPFNQNDKVALGYSIPANGIYTIAINSVDGLFADANQDIYLEDTTLGVIHDLRTAPYTFTGTLGNNETRFILRYTNETLGSEDFSAAAVSVYANENINVNASNQTITSVRVFDLLGRVIGTYNSVNATTFSTKNLAKTQSALLVEVTLESGATKTYKVIF